ncbi:MAG: hypothetical protein OXI72_18460 [Gemmatimonadota bacterium]|nr:hypothetical protein [Gemmatimonadota bacterium]
MAKLVAAFSMFADLAEIEHPMQLNPVMGLMRSPATLVVAANQISSVMISLKQR